MSRNGQVVESEEFELGQVIQVSGLKCFPESHWRDAVLYYLNGVWSNNDDVMYRPKISFDGIVLRLDTASRTYYAYGQERSMNNPIRAAHVAEKGRRVLHPTDPSQSLEVNGTQNDTEIALIRFVKDNRISELVVRFRHVSASFTLRKTLKRGEYIIIGCNLPMMEDAPSFYGFEE